jgi:CDP-diacylglycerol--glycerol-3-phosphate 3-phosphatidyltransferase
MNLPNQLTVLRIVLSFVLIFCLLTPGFTAKIAAIVVFAIASFTDLLDGRLARKQGLVTDFGVLMDPLADKVLVLSAFVSFIQLNLIPAWMVVVIAAREFLVTGFRMFALSKGRVLAAEAGGKHKMVSQVIAISVSLIYLAVAEKNRSAMWLEQGKTAVLALVLVTVVLTLTSGVSFLWRNRRVILDL